jgi:hypothetical protein
MHSNTLVAYIERTFDIDLDVQDHQGEQQVDLSMLHRILTQRIVQLLSTNPSKVTAALYRIDVEESYVNNVLEHAAPNEIAAELATLIIQRQQEKHITRSQWRNS